MRHKRKQKKLGRDKAHRKALLANLVRSLLFHEEIITTEAKAKEAARFCERVITLAKENSVHHRRNALKFVHDKKVMKKLFDIIGPRYRDREGGYTRIIKLGFRDNDRAKVSLIELVDFAGVSEKDAEEKPDKKKKASKKKEEKAE